MSTVKIGVVGVGSISGIYLKNITEVFREIEVSAVYDLVTERAEQAAERYHIAKVHTSMEDLFADDNVDIVLNLTRPFEHFAVTKAALLAGKHVYSEKPLGATLEEGEALVALAKEKGLLLGGAPDTFMGAGIQTCRKLIEDGYIGEPIGSACFMFCHGHETWHPDPAFYYQFGGGPMMDMGPYYVSALVTLMGGIKSVSGFTRKNFAERTVTSAPHFGEKIKVEAPSHVMGMLNFDSGATGTIITSFDVHYEGYAPQARFEIYGTKGTMIVPDPNFFGGEIKVLRPEADGLASMPLCFEYKEDSRALGIADMAKAVQTGRAFRADSALTLHVLEVITSFERSNDSGAIEEIKNKYIPCAPMKNTPLVGVLED